MEMEEFAPKPDLPKELIINILLRLPAKSVGRFRCVSKPWRSMLSNPKFIEAHLANHAHDQEKLILISGRSFFTLTFTPGSSNHATSKELTFSEHLDKMWCSIVGSCNGFVLVVNQEEIWSFVGSTEVYSKFLMNPTIMEIVKLPENPLAPEPFNRHDYLEVHGLGYDNFNNDYKITTLSYFREDDEHRLIGDDIYVDVYSVKMGSWRRLENFPYDHSFSEFDSGIFFNGALHWGAFSKQLEHSYVIAAFDLNTEEFREVQPPSDLDTSKLLFHKLMVIGGCLGMVAGYDCGIDVWMMKEYGVGESWTECSVDSLEPYYDSSKPVCQLGKEMVVFEKSGQVVVYNLTEEILRDLVTADNSFVYLDSADGAMAFSESLVSPCFYSRNKGQNNSEDEV